MTLLNFSPAVFFCLFFFSFPCSFSWGNFNGKSSNTAVNFVMAMLWIPRHTVFLLKQELPPQCCMHPCFSYFEVYINSCSECLHCLGTGPSSLNPLQDNHCYVAILSPTWYFLVPSTSDFFFFSPWDVPQQLATSVCKPQGGVVSSLSLHPAGQSSQNRSLARGGNETLGCQMDTFASRGQQKRGKRPPLYKCPPLTITLTVGSSKAIRTLLAKLKTAQSLVATIWHKWNTYLF